MRFGPLARPRPMQRRQAPVTTDRLPPTLLRLPRPPAPLPDAVPLAPKDSTAASLPQRLPPIAAPGPLARTSQATEVLPLGPPDDDTPRHLIRHGRERTPPRALGLPTLRVDHAPKRQIRAHTRDTLLQDTRRLRPDDNTLLLPKRPLSLLVEARLPPLL